MSRLEDQIQKAKEYGFNDIVVPLDEAEKALEALRVVRRWPGRARARRARPKTKISGKLST